VVNAFADTIKFLDLDLALIFKPIPSTIDLNRLSAWAAGEPSTFVATNGKARQSRSELRVADLPGSPGLLARESSIPECRCRTRNRFCEACWKRRRSRPRARTFDGDRHGELVAQFVEIEMVARGRGVAFARGIRRDPARRLGEMRVIRRNRPQACSHPLRKLMRRQVAIQKIKRFFS
jgi:hypothetical protein